MATAPASLRAPAPPSSGVDVADAVVVGAGPNGLVAANHLADAGWSVVVLEAAAHPGGAVRSAELAAPGFTSDLFSAFHPLAAASPALADLDLGAWGLRWCRSPAVLAHPRPHGPAAVLEPATAATAFGLDALAPGDGAAWRDLMGRWHDVSGPVLEALFTPFPPVRGSARLLARARLAGARDLVRLALLPVRDLAAERFVGESPGLLLAGLAQHADILPEAAGSGLFGWLMAGLAETVGFPAPQGGAQRLTDALVARLADRGGHLRGDAPVVRVVIEAGRATGVEVAGGGTVRARRAVVAAVGAPALYRDLVGLDRLPPAVGAQLHRFRYDPGTVKVDWALRSPVPWTDPAVARAATVHLADSLDEISEQAFALALGRVPNRPLLLMGQMGVADPTRSPPGTETVWAYAHVPQPARRDAPPPLAGPALDRFVEEAEDRIEAHAPGFRDLVVGRHVAGPAQLEAADANLVGGAVGGGSAQLHQQLVFRPLPGWGRAESPVAGLFLASASAHPGGGVHGGPGRNAARAAVAHDRRRRFLAVVGGRPGGPPGLLRGGPGPPTTG